MSSFCATKHTLSALPLSPTSVPRRVNKLCEAVSETDSNEYGVPITSNRASAMAEQSQVSELLPSPQAQLLSVPGDSTELGTPVMAGRASSPVITAAADGAARVCTALRGHLVRGPRGLQCV